MSYLNFIRDEHLLKCIHNLYLTYSQCQQQMTMTKFYSNKVDPIKFHFDMSFNHIDPQNYIDLEIIRQNDKTISNAIGYFHQNLLGGIAGFENMGVGGGCDIRKLDNTIFAEVKNKHNTMNSSSAEATYQKLEKFANDYPNATCYLVEIIAKKSQNIQWSASLNGKNYNHPRVRRISADKFYELATGRANAFKELCEVLPRATQDYLKSICGNNTNNNTSGNLYNTIHQRAKLNNLDILSQIMKDNFNDYNGF